MIVRECEGRLLVSSSGEEKKKIWSEIKAHAEKILGLVEKLGS